MEKITAWFKSFIGYTILPFFTSATPGSIGRIFMLATYIGMFVRFWSNGTEPPDSMVQTFYACLAYVFSTKIVEWKSGTASSFSAGTASVTTVAPKASGEPEAPAAPVAPIPAAEVG